jgi:hypothetical protein
MGFLGTLFSTCVKKFTIHNNKDDDTITSNLTQGIKWIKVKEGMYQSFSIVEKWSKEFNIDNSHNVEHSKEALFWLLQILKKSFSSSSSSPSSLLTILLSIHGIILHDVLDKKYMKQTEMEDYRQLLLFHLENIVEDLTEGHTALHGNYAHILVHVMESISYSKTVIMNPITHKEEVQFPHWISSSSSSVVSDDDDMGISHISNISWFDIYHWIREADLLASYNIARMIEFRSRKLINSNSTDDEIEIEWNEWLSVVKDTQALYEKRIATLLEKNLFVHKESKEIAEHLSFVSDLKMKTLPRVDNLDAVKRLKHFQSISSWDYYRIVNHIDKEELVEQFVRFLEDVDMFDL